jgi:predicted nucleic acid-binding protein
MTAAVFADTFYWVALTHKHDARHQDALTMLRSFQATRIVTSDAVLTEYLNFFAEWGEAFRRKAESNVRSVLAAPSVTVIAYSREVFLNAIELYAARPDKGYSLTDCISMLTMRREGITDVLTNDRHFEQEGFRLLFREG